MVCVCACVCGKVCFYHRVRIKIRSVLDEGINETLSCKILKCKHSERTLYLYYFLLYFSVLFAFLCPLFKCNDIGQKIYSKVKSILLKLDFGIGEYINQKKRERSGRSSLIISSVCRNCFLPV
jgi:hypothetical protein